MESLSETQWDAVISGTGLQQSLLALALSRSDKKVLHVDHNQYYGGSQAAFSLQEVEEWVERVNEDPAARPFQNASLWKTDVESSNTSEKLGFSRAYTLTLSPQIIYTKSKLLAKLVSSKVYRQLEFQAVGNWWIYDAPSAEDESPEHGATLKRLPNGREDIFQDSSIDNRAKRSLMKFLKFVIDYENQTEIWESFAASGLLEFLSSQFHMPPHLQTVIAALTLSLESQEKTLVSYALPRIARHLTSIGVFGPGFGAVVPKWGGGAEIAQVACRAGAVGGGIYVLGTGVKDFKSFGEGGAHATAPVHLEEVNLSNGETVKTRHLACAGLRDHVLPNATVVSKIIAVASSPLSHLFESSVEGSPLAAVSVVVFPAKSLLVEGTFQPYPVYIMIHSSDTGECPVGQNILYATTLHSSASRMLLECAISSFLKTVENGAPKLLYSLYYEQQQMARFSNKGALRAPDSSLDLAFDDEMLDDVELEWKKIIGSEAENASFMQFEDRAGMEDYDDDVDVDDGYD